ncbi:MAG: hypothetical protein KJN62_06180 [Deltaproteobacteria bacterium]|nr:hypothetical protein [Deltaproteobacteria bacterium]
MKGGKILKRQTNKVSNGKKRPKILTFIDFCDEPIFNLTAPPKLNSRCHIKIMILLYQLNSEKHAIQVTA